MWANSLRKEESLRREYAAVTATATQSKRDAQEAFRKEFISPTGFTFIMNLPFSRRSHQTPKNKYGFFRFTSTTCVSFGDGKGGEKEDLG